MKCCQKGKIVSNETKNKLSKLSSGVNHVNFGKRLNETTKHRMSVNHVGFFGKKHTEKVKERIRTLKLERAKILGGGYTRYNPNACRFINMLNCQIGLNLQHAQNGGEVTISGYSVDGYDKENNVVFEYDEPRHNAKCNKLKDLIRQQRIIESIKPTLFLRYDEQSDRLYDVETLNLIGICIDK